MFPCASSANSMSHGVLYAYPVPMTSSTAGQAFQVGILPLPSGASAGFPVAGSGTNQSALRYQSGSVLMIGSGLDALSFVSQSLFATNLTFLVSTLMSPSTSSGFSAQSPILVSGLSYQHRSVTNPSRRADHESKARCKRTCQARDRAPRGRSRELGHARRELRAHVAGDAARRESRAR